MTDIPAPTATPPTAADLAARLTDLTAVDERRLRGRLRGIRRISDPAKRDRALTDFERQVGTAEARVARRRATVPSLRFPPELPVSDRVDDLAAAIAANQVVIVAGETGSGKSTQLPKICLQIGRGVRGMIGHTQPRRIAARALAERIAEETGTAVGGAVGYAIRFGDHTGPDTLVKLMTDGILLNEIVRDRMLWAYDTIIIDEAHERSLNIDFLLGYLRDLLPRRPDLKLIITSATIDPQRFSQHFGDAPIVEVSGRTYPVEIRYRPFGLDEQADPDLDDGEGVGAPGARSARSGAQPGAGGGHRPGAGDLRRNGRIAAGRGRGHPGVPVRRTGDHRHRRGLARSPGVASAESPRCSRCTAGCPPPTSTRCSRPTPGDGSCWPPTWPKRRSPSRVSATSSIRARPGSPGIRRAARCSDCRSNRSRRRPPGSGPAVAAGSPTASASGCIPRRTSPAVPHSPTRRSPAPRLPRSSCRWRRSISATSPFSGSSTRPTAGRSPTG